jgi:hypothetical protein
MSWENILKRDKNWTPHKKDAPRRMSRPTIDTRTAKERTTQRSQETGGEAGVAKRKATRENKEAAIKELKALESLVDEAQWRLQRKDDAEQIKEQYPEAAQEMMENYEGVTEEMENEMSSIILRIDKYLDKVNYVPAINEIDREIQPLSRARQYVDTGLSKRNRDKFPMLRKSILKFFGPRQFLEHFQEKLGGEIYSSHISSRAKGNPELKLDYGKDFLKVKSHRGQFHISKKDAVIASSPSLKELVPIIERNLGL